MSNPNQNKPPKTKNLWTYFITNFVGGIGWAAGMTIGFALFVYLFSKILNLLGGLPLVGEWFATIISNTQQALSSKSL